jgi:DNA polymerase-3 subunit delta'
MSLFPSTLIIASSPQISSEKALEYLSNLKHLPDNNPDLFIVDQYSIATVRLLKNFLSQKPFNHYSKIVLIPEADNLNPESQNALLKNLEEPGKNNYFILTTSKPQLLLPTILSRCQKIKIVSPKIQNENKAWSLSGNPKKDLDFASSIVNDKNEIKNLLLSQLEIYQQKLVRNPDKNTARIIKKIITALKFIDANVDPKSALDYFFLK